MQIWNKSRLFEIKKSSRMKSSYRRLFSKYQRLMQYRKQTSLRLCANRERIMPAFNRIRMGNSCKPMAVSFQCMTKFTTNKKKKKKKKVHLAQWWFAILFSITIPWEVPQHSYAWALLPEILAYMSWIVSPENDWSPDLWILMNVSIWKKGLCRWN